MCADQFITARVCVLVVVSLQHECVLSWSITARVCADQFIAAHVCAGCGLVAARVCADTVCIVAQSNGLVTGSCSSSVAPYHPKYYLAIRHAEKVVCTCMFMVRGVVVGWLNTDLSHTSEDSELYTDM